MTEYVYRPSRRVNGKRVLARLYRGRYSLGRGHKAKSVALHTPDRSVAAKRLRDIVVTAQQELEGMIPSASRREAATTPFVVILADYRNDLVGRGLKTNHVKETVRRIELVAKAARWSCLADVTPSSFVAVRARMTGAAKTKKEYQTSVNALLNWCVRMDRLEENPLARVDRVETRGKAVRKSRAFTQAEFSELLKVAPPGRRLVYQFLAYTGCRKNEAASLRWHDLDLGPAPIVLFSDSNTKAKRRRVVPLMSQLVALLAALRDKLKADGLSLGDFVFSPFPSDDALHADLRKAGIARRDAAGRVLHFHAFRKTFQTWGAVAGVGQRSAQEILGHSDPTLTAEVYTDVASLELHREVGKLPWISGAHIDAHEKVRLPVRTDRFREICEELVVLAKSLVPDAYEAQLSFPNWLPGMDSNPAKAGEGVYNSAHIEAHARAAICAVLALGGVR